VTGNLRSSGWKALRAGSVIGLAGLVILVAGLLLRLDWVAHFAITVIAVGVGMTLTGAAFQRTATSLESGASSRKPSVRQETTSGRERDQSSQDGAQ
jgi:hypothetical protein